ncbi:MAG: Hsp20/alpha crystallin family protein [Deltaproteobacteria bacterium]|nr:Hsp20/alpha crystallin family protein [Deltaproteobacteria bacterium]
MALVSWRGGSLDDLLHLQGALGKLLENPTLGWNMGPSSASVFPPIDVFADAEGGLVVRAEAPGVDPEKLDIQIEPGRLTLSGERLPSETAGAPGNGYHRRERRFGRFSRSVQLPRDLDPSRADASYKDGMVTIRLPKAEEAKPRRISIAS